MTRRSILLFLTAFLYWSLLSGLSAGGIESLSENPPGEILSPDVAFVPMVESVENGKLSLGFDIQPGYYLYKKSLQVNADSENITITDLQLPDGIEVEDEFFGKTRTFRHSLQFNAAFSTTDNADPDPPARGRIVITSQGCADIGICYPPQQQTLEFTLPKANRSDSNTKQSLTGTPTKQKILEETTPERKTPSIRDTLNLATNSSALIGDIETGARTNSSSAGMQSNVTDLSSSLLATDLTDAELLPPDIAFIPSLRGTENNIVDVNFHIEDGYYLYKNKINARLVNAANAAVTNIELPEGKMKNDPLFGMVPTFRTAVNARISISSSEAYKNATLEIEHQGCADIGVCFPPQVTSLPIVLAANATATTIASIGTDQSNTPVNAKSIVAQSAKSDSNLSEQDRLAKSLTGNNIWLIGLTFFGLGLLLAFTPCVFPMIPILSSIIAGQGDSMTTRKAFSMSLVYVLAMAATYTLAGVAVGLSGENIQIWFQNPWVLSGFAILFVLLSLSMFGFYELQMPASVQTRLNRISNSQQGGTTLGVAIMGVLSALIVGPCVTAPLVGALIYIADTGNAVVGGIALFCLSLGMGAPLLLIGASCGKLLPRAGRWMEGIKAVFGVMMLAMAIWMLSRFIPGSATLALAAALAVISAIYLGATDTMSKESTGFQRLFKGAGILILVYGIALFAGSLSGGQNLLQPLKSLLATGSGSSNVESDHELNFQRIKSVADLDKAVSDAASQGRPVMLDFYADWCISCKEMEAFTFTDAKVINQLSNAVLIQADVTANDETDKALLKRFGLFGPPAIIFYSTDGEELRNARVVGFMAAEKFSNHIEQHL